GPARGPGCGQESRFPQRHRLPQSTGLGEHRAATGGRHGRATRRGGPMTAQLTGESGGKIVTFYSYKGGVGRTMALANVAWILASNGYRVLAVDWDLESPGLHRYFHPFLEDKALTKSSSLGILDMIRGYVEAVLTPPTQSEGANWIEQFT